MKSGLRKILLLICLSLSLFSCSALGDGIVFPEAAPAKTPDQRAMLQFSNGVERLVIETSFVGQGTNFAWVVPLPSVPKVESVSTNFFTYINLAYQPKFIRESDPWYVLVLLAGYFLMGGVRTFRQKGFGQLPAWLMTNFLIAFLLLIMVSSFLPAGQSFSTAAPPSAEVQLINRESVGIYNTATLAGTNGEALLNWLNSHGFSTPKSALPVIESYGSQGWAFVAATVNRNAFAGSGSRPHPLSFTFKTERPVYPLRLTAVENPHCTINLFVFGPGKAEAPGFEAEYCGHPSIISAETPAENDLWAHRELFGPSSPGDFKFDNAEVLRLISLAPITTKLVGTLSSEQMQSDALINWSPFNSVVPTYYARSAMAGEIANWFFGILLPGLFLLQLFSPWLQRKYTFLGCSAVLLASSICGIIRYSTIRTTEVAYGRPAWMQATRNFRDLDSLVEHFAKNRTNSIPLTEASFLAELSKYNDESELPRYSFNNTFSDQPLRCEATPGNITLQPSTNGTDLYWYDVQGAPHKLAMFPSKEDFSFKAPAQR